MVLMGFECLNIFLKRSVCKKTKQCVFHVNESEDLKILRVVNITLKASGRKDDIVTSLLSAFLLIRR